MPRLTLLVPGTVLLVAAFSSRVDAQSPAVPPAAKVETVAKPGTDTAAKADTGRASIHAAAAAADTAAIELARAATVLAANVEKVVKETANDPAVRLAAIQAAGQAVALAQSTLSDHLGEIEKALAEASRKLAELAARQTAATPAASAPSSTP